MSIANLTRLTCDQCGHWIEDRDKRSVLDQASATGWEKHEWSNGRHVLQRHYCQACKIAARLAFADRR